MRLVSVALILLLGVGVHGVEESAESKEIVLFNGKDLTGWTAYFRDSDAKMEDVFIVKEDGILHCKGQPIGYIRTTQDYTSYILTFEWRFPDKPGNSGALLRVQEPDTVWPRSMEAQLHSGDAGDIWNIGNFDMRADASRTEGRRTRKMNPSSEKPLGEWNQYEIILDGDKLTLKVNGVVQNIATDCEVIPGKIALQSEGAPIEFRNIVLKSLE